MQSHNIPRLCCTQKKKKEFEFEFELIFRSRFLWTLIVKFTQRSTSSAIFFSNKSQAFFLNISIINSCSNIGDNDIYEYLSSRRKLDDTGVCDFATYMYKYALWVWLYQLMCLMLDSKKLRSYQHWEIWAHLLSKSKQDLNQWEETLHM